MKKGKKKFQVVLHHSNIDLESQLRHQSSGPSSGGSSTGSGKRFHPTPSPSSVSSSAMGNCVNRVMADPDEGEALSKAKSTVTKQSAEILSLRNQVLNYLRSNYFVKVGKQFDN